MDNIVPSYAFEGLLYWAVVVVKKWCMAPTVLTWLEPPSQEEEEEEGGEVAVHGHSPDLA